ncbi:MAG: zinc ribbon domain-containing protein [Deltaproteobacteria bacterium]|nr:zinc ribbon domain-containing protein [Deltaproteobacteria bacterium]
MPIYEHECRKCGHNFERLVFSSDNGKCDCPRCGSEETKRIMSCFSSRGTKSSEDAPSFGATTGGCGTGGFS